MSLFQIYLIRSVSFFGLGGAVSMFGSRGRWCRRVERMGMLNGLLRGRWRHPGRLSSSTWRRGLEGRGQWLWLVAEVMCTMLWGTRLNLLCNRHQMGRFGQQFLQRLLLQICCSQVLLKTRNDTLQFPRLVLLCLQCIRVFASISLQLDNVGFRHF